MPYLVNCRDCGYMAARNTTHDMANGSLVKDQHESATFEKVGEGEFEKHEVVLETRFWDEKSEFHESNFEDNFGDSLSRSPAPRALFTQRKDRVVVVRDEYGSGRVSVYPIHDVPSFVRSNRYSILHAPPNWPGIKTDEGKYLFHVKPCECGSRGFERADPVRCIECGNIPPSVRQREVSERAEVEIKVVE